jgi:hypothetical protein
MNVKTGLEIVTLYQAYGEKITELQDSIDKLEGHGYTQTILREQLSKLRIELRTLEDTRFQLLEPVVILSSLLGGK